jgi:hypothetical protein
MRRFPRRLALLLLSAALLAPPGCAWRNREHTPLFNASEKYLVPMTQPARAMSFPVTVPVSLAAVAVDLLLVHPVMELPRAYDDTKDALWELHWADWKGEAFTQAASLLPRVALTPVVFAGDWLGRSVAGSDTPRHGASGRHAVPVNVDGRRAEGDARLRALAAKKDRAGFLAAADNLCPAYPDLAGCRTADGLRALDARQFDRLAESRAGWQEVAWRDDDASIVAAALRHGDGAGRAAVLAYMAGGQFPRGLLSTNPALLDAVGGLTIGADKALALQAVLLLAQAPPSEGVAAVLSGVASGNDPVLAYHAAKALKRQPKRQPKR